jgi:hypothetical protein
VIRTPLLLASILCVAACGGPSGSDATSGGGGGGSAGAGGTGGSGGASVDPCALTSMKVCQNSNCHGGAMVYADLHLDDNVLTKDYAPLVDKPNHGDPAGCMPAKFKLIDSTNPTASLIYTKLPTPGSTPPCGLNMPVIGTFGDADRMCVLSWINSVIAATKGP